MSFLTNLICLAGLPVAEGSTPWWVWLLFFLAIVFLVVLAVLLGPRFAPKEDAEEKAASLEPETFVEPDDLKRIEGIGPKIASVLQAAGIATFASLADTDVSRLQEILDKEPRLRLADPSTWPQQARLAADGDWTALEKLQDELSGGREA